MPDSMDWVKAEVRSCDCCGRETDAGEWPDWPEGICENCDPEILLNYFDCDDCQVTLSMDFVKVFHPKDSLALLLCVGCYSIRKENEDA
jgi:hypothetical protein